jgi:hypothetical protein
MVNAGRQVDRPKIDRGHKKLKPTMSRWDNTNIDIILP